MIPFVLGIGYLNSNQTFDINIGDTYFVIEQFDLAKVITIFYILLAILYFVFEKLNIQLNNKLVLLHIAFTILIPIIKYILSCFLKDSVRRDVIEMMKIYEFNAKIKETTILLIFGSIIAQFLLVSNILISLFRKKAC